MAITNTGQPSAVEGAVSIEKDPNCHRLKWTLENLFPCIDISTIKRVWLCFGEQEGIWDIRNADVGTASDDSIGGSMDGKTTLYVQLFGTIVSRDKENKEILEIAVSHIVTSAMALTP